MRFSASAVTLTAVLLANGASAQGPPWLSFSKLERSLARHDFTVDVDFVARNGHLDWIATRTDREKGQPARTSWADSDACPAMLPAFARLQSIEPFRIAPPGIRDGASGVILDGDYYEIHAHGYWAQADRDGEIVISGNSGPVMTWVEDTMKVLAPCWSKKQP